MTEPIKIGLSEIYAGTQRIEGKVDVLSQKQGLTDYRLNQMETEWAHERARRWQLNLALLAALVAIIMGSLSIILR